MNKQKRFTFEIPLLKAQEIEVERSGKKVKKRIIEGKASSTDLDLHGDRMAPSAIESMAESIKKQKVSLNAEHDKSWQSDLGEVTELSVTDEYELMMKAELDETSKANDLWYALTVKGKKLGLSIGGAVKDYKIEIDTENDSWVRTYTNIELDHVAVTSTPANPKTWISAIAKSVDSGFESKKETDKDTENEDMSLLMELAKNIKDGKVQLITKQEDMKDKTPLETDVVKDEVGAENPSTEENTVTPENGDVVTEEAVVDTAVSAEDNTVDVNTETADESKDEDATVSDEETTEEAEVKDEEVTDTVETPVSDENSPEASEEDVKEDATTEETTTEEVPVEEESVEKTFNTRIESIEKSVEQVLNFIKGENELTKALSTITDTVTEVSKDVVQLKDRINAMENQPAGRQVSEVGKGLGGVATTTSEPELSLEEALKKAEVEHKHSPSLFAIKQRIRETYKSQYGITE